MTTKQEIIRWWNTSILPADGTEDLNTFMLDTSILYDCFHRMPDGTEVGLIYKNLTKAMKAYTKYGFTPDDILKMHPRHDEIMANSVKIKSVPEEHQFQGFRFAVPGHSTQTLMS